MKKTLLLFGLLVGFYNAIFSQDTTQKDFFSTEKVHKVVLQFDRQDWRYQLDSLRVQGGDYLLGNVTLDGVAYPNVGVRYRNNRGFKLEADRNAYEIKLNYINKKQNHQGYENITLSDALRDPSLLREVMGFEIARGYMPAPQAGYSTLIVNGRKAGLYVSLESIDKAFLRKHFGDDEGSFFKVVNSLPKKMPKNCKNNLYGSLEYEENANCYITNFEMLSEDGWDDLMTFSRILSETPKEAESLLDVDNALWMLAFNNALANLDSYSGKYSRNYYLYKDSSNKYHFILGDLRFAFGSLKSAGEGSDLDLKGLQKMDPLLHKDNATKPLVKVLLADGMNKKVYLDHIRTIIYDHFVNEEYLSRAKELQNLIRNDFIQDPHKYYTSTDFSNSLTKTIGKRSKIPGIQELMKARARFLKKHSEIAVFPPQVTKVDFAKREKFSRDQIKDFKFIVTTKNLADRVKIYYRSNSNQPYSSTYLTLAKAQDAKSENKIFEMIITPEEDSLEYYFELENAKAVGFYPSRYMHEPSKITLAELNK